MELVEFLLARIAEDEAAARAAVENLLVDERDDASRAWLITYDSMNLWPSHLAHIARHDPARVLAEREAKRGLVRDAGDVPTISMRRALKWIASPYADHPDYRSEWKP